MDGKDYLFYIALAVLIGIVFYFIPTEKRKK